MDAKINHSYTGIRQGACFELEVKKSLFIARSEIVCSESQALAVLDEERLRYPDASHHVFAYRCGRGLDEQTQIVQRYSDDGEPSGTAGLPLFNVLSHQPIDNSIIVVTRYFGGILLGTGGLVHAYGESASRVIEASEPCLYQLQQRVSLRIPYEMLDSIKYRLAQADFVIDEIVYTAEVEVFFHFPLEREAAVLDLLSAFGLERNLIQMEYLDQAFAASDLR